MFRIFIVLMFLLFCNVNAQEVSLQAGVKYNEASARIEVFSDVETKIKKEFYKDFLTDKNKKENLDYIEKNIFEIGNKRLLCPFYVKNTLVSYAVVYFDMPEYSFYYNILGKLIKFDISKNNEYPKKVFGYSRFGNLISATLEVDEDEQFVYDENGKLIAHWLYNEVLNKNNKTPKVLKLKRGTK